MAKSEPQKRYDAVHCRKVTIAFYDPTERDILDKLASVPNKAGYIKKLIRDDIKKEGKNENDTDLCELRLPRG